MLVRSVLSATTRLPTVMRERPIRPLTGCDPAEAQIEPGRFGRGLLGLDGGRRLVAGGHHFVELRLSSGPGLD